MKIETVEVPEGTFEMGSALGDDTQPIHSVTVPAFEMGKYPITQAQWFAVMGTSPSRFKGDDLPVESVSWGDAQEFCVRLSERTGRAYRLPSEAEWEYACRAGSDGDRIPTLKEAWTTENACGTTHPVGMLAPNAWGLFDMHGNVWEWCEDLWHENYEGAPTDGAPTDGSPSVEGDSPYRVLRGGSWSNHHFYARAVYRFLDHPASRGDFVGFRVLLCGVSPFSGD